MKLRTALFLVIGALLLAGPATPDQKDPAQAQKQKCIATCKSNCKKSYDTCKKNANSSSALQACQTSLETCNGNCLNKACE